MTAELCIKFIELLKLTGDFYGQPFHLLPWQREVIEGVYGTERPEGGRQYKYAYLEIPKKNGKTELIASLALAHAALDPPSGQIYCCAAEREQASLVYIAAKQKIEQDGYLGELLRVVDSKKEIHNIKTGTFIKVLSAEAYSKHGLNPTVIIFDELHALQKRDLWDTMTFGSGAARKEQLIWIITTAGDDPDRKSIGFEQHEYARKVRDGEIKDPSWYVRIYGAPEDADIYSEEVWRAANPSLGVTISLDAVRQEALQAKNSPAAERLFRWLRLNQWVALKRVSWLPITLWDSTTGRWGAEELKGGRCYVGLDLSTTTDITAAVLLFPPCPSWGGWRFLTKAWIPAENMAARSSRDHVPYDAWAREGYLTATPGDVVDYGAVAGALTDMARDYDVQYYCADPWRLEYLKQLMPEALQERFVEIPQSISGMSCGMQELDRMFRAGEISHPFNPLGRWAFGNTVVAIDGNGNTKPMKNKSLERIDPTVALINAMAGAIRLEPRHSVYETRGLRVV